MYGVGGKLTLLQTGNLYVPAADEGGKHGVAVLDAIAVKLQYIKGHTVKSQGSHKDFEGVLEIKLTILQK